MLSEQLEHRTAMSLTTAETTLILIDLQERLTPAIEEGAAVLTRCALLARAARALNIPVLGTEQNPAGLGATVAPLAPLVDRIISKMSFDACRESALLEALEPARRKLVVAGCETHVCVLQTVLGLHRRNFEVFLAADAVGSRRSIDRATALSRLERTGIEMVTAEMVVFEWLERCDNPKFKDLLALIR
jgi:nicotinamidase-related amidase